MLCGDKVIIKTLDKKHLEMLRNLRNDFDNTSVFLTTSIPISEASQTKWHEALMLDQSKMYMAIEDRNGIFVGIIRADEWDRINGSIRIGMDIVPEWRGKGIATDAYKTFIKYLFDNLRIHRIWLEVLDYNERAISLYKKLGFEEEGRLREAVFKKGTYHDYLIMSLLKSEYDQQN